MSKLAKVIREQEFYPGFLGLFTNPAYFARKELLKKIKNISPSISGKVLDVGCGTKPYQKLFNNIEYVGLEIDTPKNRSAEIADFFYKGTDFPFANGEFDAVIASEVLEHVFNPDIFLTEVNRIMKKNSLLLLTVPFMWGEHEQPYDYGRYSSFGIKHILEKNGFEIKESHKTLTDIRAIFQFINSFSRYWLRKIRNRKIKLMAYVLVFGFFNILGTILYKIFPKNNEIYIDNIILAKKN